MTKANADELFLYLKKLKFDKKLYDTFHAKFILNFRLVIILVVSVFALGITSLLSLDRKLNPEVNISFVNVVTVLPGVSPKEIEELVTVPLENALADAEGLENLQSFSQENVSVLSLEFKSGTNVDSARDEVQALIDTVSLPEDAIEPDVTALDFENQPISVLTLTGSVDEASLYKKAEELKDALENSPKIKSVTLAGVPEAEIQVLVSPESIVSNVMNPFDLMGQIKSNLTTIPGGAISGDTADYSFAIDKSIKNIDDIRNIPISQGREVTTLGNVTKVTETKKPGSKRSYFVGENKIIKQAVSLAVFKAESAKIDEASVEAQKIAEEVAGIGGSFKIVTSQSAGEEIKDQFAELGRTFLETIFLVFITLLVFLGIRQAAVVSFTIPITFLASFTIMLLMGISLNFLSLFSLLLSLGLLVDDAIVTTSAMTSYWNSKKFTPEETGLLVWRDFIIPIWSTTLTTIWAFVPLLLSTGIIGEFIKSIPIVVSATLLSSTATAVLVTLPLLIVIFKGKAPKRVKIFVTTFSFLSIITAYGAFLPKEPRPVFVLALVSAALFLVALFRVSHFIVLPLKNKYLTFGFFNIDKAAAVYAKALRNILKTRANRWKALALVFIFSIFSYALLPLGFVVNEFFPKTDSKILFINLELPIGTRQEITEVETLRIMDTFKNHIDIESITADVGRLGDTGSGEMGSAGSHTAQLSLRLKEKNSIKVAGEIRSALKTYDKGKVSVIELSGGPPAGADIVVKVSGEDLTKLEEITDNITDYLKSQSDIINIQKSSVAGTSKVTLIPNLPELKRLGITPEMLGGLTRFHLSGLTVDTVNLNGHESDIVIRTSVGNLSASALNRVLIPTMTGPVPITSLGDTVLVPNPSVIRRENGLRTISVSGGVVPGASVSEPNKKVQSFMNTQNLPEGYTWDTGGVNEENQSSVNSILQAMVVAALLILVTMVIQLGSFRKATIVLLVIPLAISGVFILFALTRTPLSFPALIGILALYGIAVNNSMMMVAKINQNEAAGIDFVEGLIDAAQSRVEPIFLTSLITIMGLVPITISDPLWRGLGGAIIAGLSVSGLIMLFFIPIVYYMWFVAESKKTSS